MVAIGGFAGFFVADGALLQHRGTSDGRRALDRGELRENPRF
jgi:hypothetical protein